MVDGPRRVLLAGHSNLTFSEEGPNLSLTSLMQERLGELAPAYRWECYRTGAPLGKSLAAGVEQRIDELEPEVVLLALTATSFAHEFVTNRIRRRWKRLYDPAMTLSRMLKAGGNTSDEDFRPNPLLFRLPEMIAFRLIGGEPFMRLERTIEHAREAIELVVRHEEVVSVCRMPGPTSTMTGERVGRYYERVGRFNVEVVEMCRARRLPHFNFEQEMRHEGRRVAFARDGIHFNLATRRAEADITARQILRQLEIAAATTPLPAPIR